jgi:hypothetical protein
MAALVRRALIFAILALAASRRLWGANWFGNVLTIKRASRVKCEKSGNIFEREQWPAMVDFMADAMVRLETSFKEPLAELAGS